MALLEVLTRCNRRPQMLMANIRSLTAQSDSDWEQTFIVDTAERGIGQSYDALATQPVHGEYIWILDDDDLCIYPNLVSDLRRLAVQQPGVVMVKMDHGSGLGVLPDTEHWGKPPEQGYIGCSAFVVRRDVWDRNAAAFAHGHYASDFAFINTAWKEEPVVVWHDVIASQVQQISHGVTE
jgi:hypothetical protein